MEVTVTKHAGKRLKSRLGLPKKAAQRHAEMVFQAGARHRDVRGRLKRYMDKMFLQHKTATEMRAYGQHLYLFCGSNLVTVLQLPSNMRGGIPDAAVSRQ